MKVLQIFTRILKWQKKKELKKNMGKICDSLHNKSRSNRMFFDSLIRLIWCECKAENKKTKSKNLDDWADIELPSFTGMRHSNHSDLFFKTPREILSERELNSIMNFINENTFYSINDAKSKMLALFNACMICALNEIQQPQREFKEIQEVEEQQKPQGQLKLAI